MEILKKINITDNSYLGLVDLSSYGTDYKRLVTDCAAVTRGKEHCQNVESRYKALASEHNGISGRPFEYVPIKIKKSVLFDFFGGMAYVPETFFRFAHSSEGGVYFKTNLRNFLQTMQVNPRKVYYDLADFLTTDSDFKIIRGRIPFKAYYQLATHTQVSSMCETSRIVSAKGLEFDCSDTVSQNAADSILQLLISLKDSGMSQDDLSNFYPRNLMVDCVFAGWSSDTLGYKQMVEVRLNTKHTQAEAKKVTSAIKTLCNL